MVSGNVAASISGMRGGRLIAVLLLIAFVPLGLIGALTFRLAQQSIRTEVEARAKSNAAVTAALIDQYMAGLASVVESFAKRPSLIKAFNANDPSKTDRGQVVFHLQALAEASEGISLAFLAEIDGDLVDVVPPTPSIVGKNFAFRDWYIGLNSTGKTYISEAYQTQATGEALVVAAATFVRSVPSDDSSDPLGILVAGYDFKAMRRFVDNFSDAQGTNTSVADQRGVLVASSGHSSEGLTSKISDVRIRNGLRGREGIARIDTESGPTLSAYHPVPKIGWVVVTEVPERVAFASIAALTRALGGALILTAAFIAIGLVVLARTLRERDRAEVRLLNRELNLRRFGAIVDSSDDAIISQMLDGTITSWNPGAERLYGYTATEAIGRSISMLLPEDRPNEVSDILERIGRGQSRDHFDTVRVRRDGGLVDVSLTVSPVKNDEGEPIGASTIGRDISIRKKAEIALKQSETKFVQAYAKEHAAVERLEELDKLKNEFVGVISHDLRSPMAVISGYTALLIERWEQLDESRKLDFLQAIQRSVHQQVAMVEDVLQVARLESGELQFELAPVDMGQLITSIVTDAMIAADARQIRAVVEPDLPKVMADQPRLQRILSNLIGNALKFSPDGQPVEIAARRKDGQVEVRVTDHGIGMYPRDLRRVFDKFTRVEQPGGKSQIKGTGLGLYITKRFVEGQGGGIWVESEPGEGSTFTFTLPAVTSETQEAEAGGD